MKRSSLFALCLLMAVVGGPTLARDAAAASPKRGGTLTVVHGVDISNNPRIGHLVSISPQQNERFPPIRVEIRGRPRHP